MPLKSLNQHISLFESFSSNHKALNSFGQGDASEWYEKLKNEAGTGDKLIYPAMFVSWDRSSPQKNLLYRDYTFFFLDIQKHDEGDELEILSDMEQVALDLKATIEKSFTGPVVLETSEIIPITESGTDYVAGVQFTLRIKQPLQNDYCAVPMTGTPSTQSGCPGVSIFRDGVYEQTVASGGRFDYESGGTGSFTYDVYFDGIDTGQDVLVDGTDITINL